MVDPHGWMLKMNGAPIRRGLTRAQAEAMAAERERGYRTHRESDKQRVPIFEVCVDPQMAAQADANYRAYKQGDRILWPTS
jgi:hypothetical protein